MAKRKYRVVSGVHSVHDDNGTPTYFGPGEPAGDVVTLDEQFAERMQNKFAPYVEQVKEAPLAEEEKPKPAAQTQAQSQTQGQKPAGK